MWIVRTTSFWHIAYRIAKCSPKRQNIGWDTIKFKWLINITNHLHSERSMTSNMLPDWNVHKRNKTNQTDSAVQPVNKGPMSSTACNKRHEVANGTPHEDRPEVHFVAIEYNRVQSNGKRNEKSLLTIRLFIRISIVSRFACVWISARIRRVPRVVPGNGLSGAAMDSDSSE